MKKAAIITCSLEPNYGACLQAFSLQTFLKNQGIETTILNYTFVPENSYSFFVPLSLKSRIANLLYYKLRKSLHFAFERFREEYMVYSINKYREYEDFKGLEEEYDYIITGSDQVWNPNLGIDINVTLQRFHNERNKKVSYASSFGVESISEDEQLVYSKALNDFRAISVREETGAKIIQQLLGHTPPVVVDPTMLYDKKFWREYSKKPDQTISKKYVLVYDMRHSKELLKMACDKGTALGCPVYILSRVVMFGKNCHTLNNISPAEFLWLFDNASAIFTDSFHGTVFSLLFEKEFYSYSSSEGEMISNRITNLLSLVGLDNRLTGFSGYKNLSDIDYHEVYERIQNARIQSIQYISDNIVKDYNEMQEI